MRRRAAALAFIALAAFGGAVVFLACVWAWSGIEQGLRKVGR